MARLNFLLLIAVLGSAIYLVHTQYLSRQLFTEFHGVERCGIRLAYRLGDTGRCCVLNGRRIGRHEMVPVQSHDLISTLMVKNQ